MSGNNFSNYISRLAVKSLLYEVTASPKPGLVDRNNSGAHKDMDFFTFIDSSVALAEYFNQCCEIGFSFDKEDKKDLLKEIRPVGILAEESMFRATGGINTHKGLIFSLGIICAAAGLYYNVHGTKLIPSDEISKITKEITEGITKELEDVNDKEILTYGEKLYLKYGVKGIRGEVESGFSTALQYGLPIFKDLAGKDLHINDILVQVLLHLMVNTEDSNILGRHDEKTLGYAKKMAGTALRHGGYLTSHGKIYVEDMDRFFIEKNISPGGSADLLAVTIMLYLLEKGDFNDR